LNDRSDEDAVRSRTDADKAAYTALVRTHYRRVFGVCFGMLANVHDAEDVAQDTLLKGLVSLRRLARPERFEPWILRIARNLCVDLLRRRKRAKKLPIEPEPTIGGDTHENHDLEWAVARLPQELRLPLVLFYFENKDVGGIAGKLGISQSLVYERLRAAREELHRLLIERGTHE
jgi:RNA polymerase sigma-70 factor, ECF subfamily